MPIYRVAVREIYITGYEIEADNPAEAQRLVLGGEGTMLDDDLELESFLAGHRNADAVYSVEEFGEDGFLTPADHDDDGFPVD